MIDSKIGVVYGVVRNLVVPVLLGTSSIDRFVKFIFPSEQKKVRYNSKLGSCHQEHSRRT